MTGGKTRRTTTTSTCLVTNDRATGIYLSDGRDASNWRKIRRWRRRHARRTSKRRTCRRTGVRARPGIDARRRAAAPDGKRGFLAADAVCLRRALSDTSGVRRAIIDRPKRTRSVYRASASTGGFREAPTKLLDLSPRGFSPTLNICRIMQQNKATSRYYYHYPIELSLSPSP